MKLITIDEAFSDVHFGELIGTLIELNLAGAYDSKFLPLVDQFVTSARSKENLHELVWG